MKKLGRSLSLLSLVGAAAYGGSLPEGGVEAMDVPVVHGYEIDLPMLRVEKLPAGWCYQYVYEGGHLVPCDGSHRAIMDWGGGNAVFNVTSSSWYDASDLYYGRIVTEVDAADGFVPIAQTLGYYQHMENGLVRGSVEMLIPNQESSSPAQSEVILALQVKNGASWSDIATSRIPITNIRQMHELQALVAPYQDVRFEVRAKARPDNATLYLLWKVRMFGAQCYIDFVDPNSCM